MTDIDRSKPSEEGKRRYPPDGFHPGFADIRVACTCGPACADPCNGHCGCLACEHSLSDALE